MANNKISIEECIRIYHLDKQFIEGLQEFELMTFEISDDCLFVTEEDFPLLQKYAQWYYDMEINFPGIEMLHQLLDKMDALHQQNKFLKQKLKIYEISSGHIEDY